MNGKNFGGSGNKPINVGEEYTVTIEAVGEKGDGLARIKGFVVFVPKVKAKDRVKIRITKVLEKVGFAEVIEYVEEETPGEPEEEVQQEEPEEEYEDTEDFGEDEE